MEIIYIIQIGKLRPQSGRGKVDIEKLQSFLKAEH